MVMKKFSKLVINQYRSIFFILAIFSLFLPVKSSLVDSDKRVSGYFRNITRSSINEKSNSLRKRSIKVDDNYSYSIIPAEFYDKINEIEFITIYNLIFDAIVFNNEYCDSAFQNCLLDANKNVDTNNHHKISYECSPLFKAKHCLKSSTFHDSDCLYNSIQETCKIYKYHLEKNFEACNLRFPFKTNHDSYSSLKSNASFQCNYRKQWFFVVFSLMFFIYFKLNMFT